MILHGECWGEGVRINDCENFHHRSQVVCHGVYLKKRDKIPVRKQIDCRCDLHLHLPCFLFTFCLSVKTGDLAIIQRITIIIAFLALQGALIVIIVCSSATCTFYEFTSISSLFTIIAYQEYQHDVDLSLFERSINGGGKVVRIDTSLDKISSQTLFCHHRPYHHHHHLHYHRPYHHHHHHRHHRPYHHFHPFHHQTPHHHLYALLSTVFRGDQDSSLKITEKGDNCENVKSAAKL